MIRADLNPREYDQYFQGYLDKVPKNTELISGYIKGKEAMLAFYKSIPADKWSYRYQPEKWTIKEVFQHLIDTERVFMYRLLRIARNDRTPLAGFEQNAYVLPSEANTKSIQSLLDEYAINRDNSIALIKSISDKNLHFVGISNGSDVTARAIAFTVLGHDIWHTDIIKERYLFVLK